ncbi:hypothetical protein ES703_91631 [subsurface metagenome]
MVDVLWISIGIHDRDDRNLQLLGLLNRDFLLVRIYNKQSPGTFVHVLYSAQIFRKLPVDFFQFGLLLLGQKVPTPILFHLFHLDQLVHAASDHVEVGQQSSQPTLVDITGFTFY